MPAYVTWRAELLAELALARIPGLVVNKRPPGAPADLPYNFLVATDTGFCFFVEAKAFSSARHSSGNGEMAKEWRWRLDPKSFQHARESRSPVLLFLFDADSEEGRFLRLDTLEFPEHQADAFTVYLPAENTEHVEKLIESLQQAPVA